MKNEIHKNCCHGVRKESVGLLSAFRVRMAERLNDHITDCPRCRQRLAMVHRVEFGLTLMRTQPQHTGLLARANNKALDTLKHSLRHAPKSAALRTARTDLPRLEKIRPGLERVMNTAACVFIIFMIKTGVSSSLLDFRDQGQRAIRNYYSRNLDEQTFNEIFPSDSA